MISRTSWRAVIAASLIAGGGTSVAEGGDAAPTGHLFILSGQSNMTGGLEKGFLEVVARELGQERVSIVRSMRSGRGIRFWVKDYKLPEDHPRAGLMKDQANGEEFPRLLEAARSVGDARRFASVTLVWMQGESDANRDLGAGYATSFRSLMNRLKKELGVDKMHFVIGRISDHGLSGDQAEAWRRVREVQMDLAEADPLGSWIDTDDLNGGSDANPRGELHYPADQYPRLGARFGEAAAKQLATVSAR